MDVQLRDEEISTFFTQLEQNLGVSLDISKKYLLEARLKPVSEAANYASVGDFIRYLNRSRQTSWHEKAFVALTTNETTFFRDPAFFLTLQESVLPTLIRNRSDLKRLRIWSAAASSGQEAFSLAMMIRLYFPEISHWDIDILGSDVSPPVLAKARKGIFNESEIKRGLPTHYLDKFFKKIDNNKYQISDAIRSMVRFEHCNLISDSCLNGYYDLIFLRNVLIYFSAENKSIVLEKLNKLLADDCGALFLGGAESMSGNLKYDVNLNYKWTFYIKKGITLYDR
ncbi:MAG: protein-glutamate O-methyltransferase CheR [Burkholderiales bacterium]